MFLIILKNQLIHILSTYFCSRYQPFIKDVSNNSVANETNNKKECSSYESDLSKTPEQNKKKSKSGSDFHSWYE